MHSHYYKKFLSSLSLLLAFGVFLFALNSSAYAQDEGKFTDEQKSELGELIKGYLMDNPQVIMDSVEQYQQAQARDQEKQAGAKVAQHLSYLTDKDAPAAGNPEGDITVIEFFDYNCGYCKRALPDIQKILENDKNIRFIFREMPVLGPSSLTAAKWSLAAHLQGKYFDYHTALINHRGAKTEPELLKLAKEAGLDGEKMKKDANSSEVKALLDKDMSIARDIGIRGTPAFIVDGELKRGYLGPDGMKQAIEEARKNGN